jgi:hypothetical protein
VPNVSPARKGWVAIPLLLERHRRGTHVFLDQSAAHRSGGCPRVFSWDSAMAHTPKGPTEKPGGGLFPQCVGPSHEFARNPGLI